MLQYFSEGDKLTVSVSDTNGSSLTTGRSGEKWRSGGTKEWT
jgi:hypothetical protein